MPTYTFRVKASNTFFTEIMSIAARDIFVANTEIEQVLVPLCQIDAHKLSAVGMKPTIDFQNRLKEIKTKHRHNKIRTWGIAEV